MAYPTDAVAQLLADDSFVAWSKHGTDDARWQQYRAASPQQRAAVAQARAIVWATLALPQAVPLPGTKEAVWQRVQNQLADNDVPVRPLSRRWLGSTARYWAAASVALIIAVGGWLWQQRTPSQPLAYEAHVREAARAEANPLTEIRNEGATPTYVNLPDGSSVRLGRGSRLSYSPSLTRNAQRTVYLSGEAYFEVKKNPRQPFVVYANELVTKVLGTSFTIRAYAGDPTVRVSVRTGRVAVFSQAAGQPAAKSPNNLVLTPNQAVSLNRTDLHFTATQNMDSQPVPLAPKVVDFTFDDEAVTTIFQQIEQTYGVDMVYDETRLRGCRLTASLNDETLQDKIKLLCQSLQADYTIEANRITVRATGCE